MNMASGIRMAPDTLRFAFLFGVIGAILTGFVVVYTVNSSQLSTGDIRLSYETFVDDTIVTVSQVGIKINQTTVGAAGGSPLGIEADDTLPNVNNALTRNNYAYEFTVKEAAIADWQSGKNLKIEVYGDDGSNTTILATLYLQQSVVDDLTIEGVSVAVDLASQTVVHDNFDIVITAQ